MQKNAVIILIIISLVSGCVGQQNGERYVTTCQDGSTIECEQIGNRLVCENCQIKDITTEQSTALKCEPNWTCNDWSVCQRTGINSGIQKRTCFDNNHCNSVVVPSESKTCSLAWLDYALEINQTKSLGSFRVTLERVGFYSYQPNQYSDEKLYFRSDVKIENIGYDVESLHTYDAALIQDKNQYDYSYNSHLDASDLRPEVVREGYILFDSVPTDISGIARIDIGSSYWMPKDTFQYLNYLYSFNINLTNLTS